MKWLTKFKIFGGVQPASQDQVTQINNLQPERPENPSRSAHRYPAVNNGFDATLSPEDLLDSQRGLVGRIKVAAGGGDTYRDYYYPAMLDFAGWVHALPANEVGNHFGAGGLLRLGLEMSFHCQRIADQSLFSRSEGSEKRRVVEPAWRLASFLSGLYSELHVIPTRLVVTTSSGKTWPCLISPLSKFLEENKADRYFVVFNKSDMISRDMSSMLAQRMIRPLVLQYLQSANPSIPITLFAALSGSNDDSEHEKLYDILTRVRHKVVDTDKIAQSTNYGKLKVGIHLEPHIIDAMRFLLQEGAWVVNKSHLYYGADGLYLSWTSGCHDISKVLSDRQVTGVPQVPETIAEILGVANLIQLTPEGKLIWQVPSPSGEKIEDCVKFVDPRVLLGGLDVEPLKTMISAGKPTGAAKKQKKSSPVMNSDLFDEGDSGQKETEAEVSVDANTIEVSTLPVDAAADATGDLFTSSDTSSQPGVTTDESRKKGEQVDGPSGDAHDQKRGGIQQVNHISTEPHSSEITQGAKVIPVELCVSENAEKLLKQLHDPAVVEFLRALILDQQSQNFIECINAPFGVGIPQRVVRSYGLEETTMLTALNNNGWLGKNPMKTNGGGKYHKFVINGIAEMFMFIQTDVARSLGLKGSRNVE